MIDVTAGINGYVELIKRKNGIVTEHRGFPNTLLQYAVTELLYRMNLRYGDGWELAQYFFLGTDDTETSLNDPGLLNRSTLPGKLYHTVSFDELNDAQNKLKWNEVTLRYSYSAGEAQGVWKEFGCADSSEYSIAFNRALVRDSNGVPAELHVQADETLDVAITFRITIGLQEAKNLEMYISQDRGTVPYIIEPLTSDYFSVNSSYNMWKTGSPVEALQVLDENGNYLSFNTGPWPNNPVNDTVSPDIRTTYEKENRLSRHEITIRDGENDVYIGGFIFGPSTRFDVAMFLVTFDTPILKPAYKTVSFQLTTAVQVEYPDSPWEIIGA